MRVIAVAGILILCVAGLVRCKEGIKTADIEASGASQGDVKITVTNSGGEQEDESAKEEQITPVEEAASQEAGEQSIETTVNEFAENAIKQAVEKIGGSITEEQMHTLVNDMVERVLQTAKEKNGEKPTEEEMMKIIETMEQEILKSAAPEKVEGTCILFTGATLTEEEIQKISKPVGMKFEVSADAEAAERLGVVMPGVYYKSEAGEYVFRVPEGDVDVLAARVAETYNVARLEVFGELHKDNSPLYENLRVPIVYAVARKTDFGTLEWCRPIVESLKTELKVALLDYTSTEFFLNISGVHEHMLPALFLITNKNDKMYKYLLPNAADNEETVNFLTKCARNKEELVPFVMSEELPGEAEKANPAGVLKVVSKSFEEIALNAEVDTLIVYYAEWCRFCQNLMPGLDKVASALKRISSDVVIGKMLMSRNDMPLNSELEAIQAYPTIRIYKKGTNKEVEMEIKNKPADAEGILEFLKMHTDLPEGLTLEGAETEEAPQKREPEVKIPEEIKMDL
ncbi:protein disulfide-isomerase A1 [Nematocida major]|uniref:protein disulfide-isomerase A1 n=1 Tax=Nematocida major TaxID=1912982 RepID=UPI002008A338|nr:protein disulfide-isomerase A1 [Nematocida major]KAH9386839.1 protein disulfide-isomerase A1 [Nematocida major]